MWNSEKKTRIAYSWAALATKSHLFFQGLEIEDREITVSPLNRFINLSSNPMLEVYCKFLTSALTSLINLKLSFKRHNPVTDLMYDLLEKTLCILPSCFIQPEFVRKLKRKTHLVWEAELRELFFTSSLVLLETL